MRRMLPMAGVVLATIALLLMTGRLLGQGPDYKMRIVSPQWGLRVQTDVAGGQVGSFGPNGEFDVDAPSVTGGRLAVKENGNVGIGLPNPGSKLSVGGVVESTIGGFKFPDGTIQTSAIAAGNNYVQNTSSQQAGANFNIAGNGVVGGYFRANGAGGSGVLGNFGIGTFFPNAKLDVRTVDEGIRIQGVNSGGAANTAFMSFYDANGARTGAVGDLSTDAPGVILTADAGDVVLYTQAGPALTASQAGHVNMTHNAGVNGAFSVGSTAFLLGSVQMNTLGTGGSTTLCRNSGLLVSTCSSSLRYKTNVQPYAGGLDMVARLRPIRFDWKADGTPDVGFAAEEVNDVEPLLAFRNDAGQIEGVKYGQISAVLVNAIKDQQEQIRALQQTVTEQQRRIDALLHRLDGTR